MALSDGDHATKTRARSWLRYGLGPLEALEGLAAGSVNSNFALQAGGRRLFLRALRGAGPRGRRSGDGDGRAPRGRWSADPRTPPPPRRRAGVRWCAASRRRFSRGDRERCRCQAQVTPDDARRVGEALARVHVAGAAERDREPGRFRYEDLCARLDRIARERRPTLRAGCARAARHAGRSSRGAPAASTRLDPRRSVPRQRPLGRGRRPSPRSSTSRAPPRARSRTT